jgi:hypothetical protein
MKNNSSPFWLFVIFAALCCIGWGVLNLIPIFNFGIDLQTQQSRCDAYLPPDDLVATDLVGTWNAGSSVRNDTLILREDNTYKQIIHIESTKVDYKSEWQEWRLERKNHGLVYLHLENMRVCGIYPEKSCDDLVAGGFDFCQNESVQMVNEGVLLVLGEKKKNDNFNNTPTLESNLNLWFPLGSENTWVYHLQKP